MAEGTPDDVPALRAVPEAMTRTYCTILSTNYLPKALALAESLRRHEGGAILRILFIDVAEDDGLPALTGVECLSTAVAGPFPAHASGSS